MNNTLKILFLSFSLMLIPIVSQAGLAEDLEGKILLQVEDSGQAWYVIPGTAQRVYFGRPVDAFKIMREQSVGITNNNLNKIPVAMDFLGSLGDTDSDNDGYSDAIEIKNGYNPNGKGIVTHDIDFANQQRGKIFLQVESCGEAWYVNPDNSKRYYLGRPVDAFNIMRELGLGITNNNLSLITIYGTIKSADLIFLSSGGIVNNQAVNSSSNVLEVSSNMTINGTIKITSENHHDPRALVPVVYTPSWGEHSSSWTEITGHQVPGSHNYDVSISLTAPSNPGTYYITFASAGQTASHYVASMTGWPVGSSKWDDGNDLADFTEKDMASALTSGYALLSHLQDNNVYVSSAVGCTYVKIIVN